MLATQLRYDLLMFTRELFYLVFTVIVPPVTYVFMGQLFGQETYSGDLSYAQMYTPSFILLITFSVVFFAFGFDQVMNRTSGVEKRIFISPVSSRVLLVSSILKSVIITSLGFFLIYTIGLFVYDLPFNFSQLVFSYVFFILLNIILLVISSAIYSLFNEMKSALVFSIIIFQVVMFTGDFSVPVSKMPTFVKYIANVNPMYHLNHLFVDVWNKQLVWDKNTFISSGFVLGILLISLVVIEFSRRKKV